MKLRGNSYPISRTSLRLGASTSMALLRLTAPSGMNGGLSWTQEETFKVSPIYSRHTEGSFQRQEESSNSLPSGPSWWAWPGGAGSGRRAPSCPSSWSRHGPPGAGRRPDWGSAITQQTPKLTEQQTIRLMSYLVFHLHDSLLGQRARLDHADPLGRQLREDLLWVGGDRASSQREKHAKNLTGIFCRAEESPDPPLTAR